MERDGKRTRRNVISVSKDHWWREIDENDYRIVKELHDVFMRKYRQDCDYDYRFDDIFKWMVTYEDDPDCRIGSLFIPSLSHEHDLPKSFSQLDCLTELHICGTGRKSSHDKESRVPALISTLPNLEYLVVDCKFSSLSFPSPMGNLVNLEELTLKARSAPDEIFMMTNLQFLTLVGFGSFELPFYFNPTELKSLPDAIGDLCNLVELDLISTGFTALPPSIGNLTMLKILKFGSLLKIPDEIGNLVHLEQLEYFDMSPIEFPSTITNLKNLRVLARHDTHRSSGKIDPKVEALESKLVQECPKLGFLLCKGERTCSDLGHALMHNRVKTRLGCVPNSGRAITYQPALWPLVLENGWFPFSMYRPALWRDSRDSAECPRGDEGWAYEGSTHIFQLLVTYGGAQVIAESTRQK